MANTLPDFSTIADDFAFLDDWDERYRYLIDLGNQLPDFPDEARTEETRVRGCASQVWLLPIARDGQLGFLGDSDAAIVRGLVAVLLSFYTGMTAQQVIDADPQGALAQLDLTDHITPQRANGVVSMIERIKKEASARL